MTEFSASAYLTDVKLSRFKSMPILRHYGIISDSLVIDDTDNKRSKAAKALAHLYKLRAKESGAISGAKVSSFSCW